MNRTRLLIEPAELLNKLGNDKLRIFDATVTDAAYWQGYIPGAAYFDHGRFFDPDSPYECTVLPLDRLSQQVGPDSAAIRAKCTVTGASGISSDAEVVVYACGMLLCAARAWWLLRYAGHLNVRVLNGGLAAWRAASGPIEQMARTYAPAAFTGRPQPELFAGQEEVLAALADPEQAVINVLPIESYQAVHITGSTWLGCLDLMQGLEAFLSAEQISARLQATARYKRLVTYCGGIAAALNALAHVMVGQGNVAVYDDSMEEWTAEELPMTGTGDWEVWKR